jgi:DNA-binding response OmpR family regulator
MLDHICPTCGRSAPVSAFDIDPEAIKMPRRERQILNALIASKGRYAPREKIEWEMYSGEINGGPDGPTILAHISKLRARLKPIGWTIDCQRFEGYRLNKIGGGDV